MKKIAYLILLICILGAGYFAYNTYKIVKGRDNDDSKNDEKIEVEEGESAVVLKYREYGIDKVLKGALAVQGEETTRIYFFTRLASCSDENFEDVSNERLALFVEVDNASLSATNSVALKSTTIVNHDIEGNNLEIIGVPDKTNKVTLKQEGQELKGSLDLVWSNRTAKGEYIATICE